MMKNNNLILVIAILAFIFMYLLIPLGVSQDHTCNSNSECGPHAWCYTITNTCYCIGTYMNCDNDWKNGCEVISSDSNCGVCGVSCGGSGITAAHCDINMVPPTCICVSPDHQWAGNGTGCAPKEQTCYDSDGGKNYAVKGTTTWGTITKTDSCEPNNVLKEWYCENNQVVSELHPCGIGYVCDYGICKQAEPNPTPSPSPTPTPSPSPTPEICIPDFSCNGRECGSNGCDSCGNCVSSDGKSIGVCDDKLGICYLQSCGFSSYKIDRPTETCDVTQVGRYQFFPESFELACKRNTGYFGVLKKCDLYKCSVPSNVCEYSTSLGLNSYLDFVENVCYNGITEIKGVCEHKKEPNCKGGVGGALYKDVIYYSPSVVDNNHYKDKREIYFAQSKKFDKSQGDGNAYVSDELIDYFVREVVLRITGVDGAYNFHEKFGFLPQDLFDDILFSNCAYRGIWIGDGCDGSAPNDISMYSVCPKIKDKQGTEYSICAFDLSGSPSFSFEKQNPRCTAVLRTDGFKNTEKLTFYNEYCSEGSASKKYVDWFGVSDGTICGEKNGKALFCDAGNCVEFKSTCQNNELDNGELCDYDGSGKALFISPLNSDNSCANNPSLNKGESPWVSGDIGCIKETCGLDFSKCNSQADLCGDGIKQDFEECDGSDFGNLKNCEDLDKKFGSGNLLCKTDCTIDKNACVEKPKNETLFCSDGINNDDYFDNASDCLDGNISTCTDCQDRDCNKIGYCEFQIEISCMDGIDNDQDGKIDEEDSDCIELFDWNNNKGYCSIYYNDDNQKKACYIKTGHECVKNGNKRGDFICNDGEWVSTKLLAVNDLLLNFPNAPNDYYILHCGNPKEVFNRVNYNTQDFKNVDNMLTSCTDFACAYKNDKNDSAILLAISAQCKPTENSWAYKDFFPSYIFTKTPPESDWFNTSGYKKISPLQGYNLFLNGDSNFLVYSNKELFYPSLNTQLASSAMNGFSIISNNDFKNSKSFDSFFIYQMASAKSMGKRLNVNASFYAGVVFQGMDITTICETLKAKYQDNSLCISSQNAGYIFSTSSDSNQEIYKKHWPEYSLMVFNSFFT